MLYNSSNNNTMSNIRNSSYINNNSRSNSSNNRSRSSNCRFSQRKKQSLILHQELTLMAVCMTRFVTYCSALDPNLIAAL